MEGKSAVEERFNFRDLVQTAVGSFGGALMFSFSQEMWVLSEGLSWVNVVAVVFMSFLASFVIAYYLGVRKLGGVRKRLVFHFIPLRVTVHYLSSLFFSAVLLYLLGVNTSATPVEYAVKRVIVLSLPATVLGSTVDLIDSQRN
jgi:uncharacterized membrane protein